MYSVAVQKKLNYNICMVDTFRTCSLHATMFVLFFFSVWIQLPLTTHTTNQNLSYIMRCFGSCSCSSALTAKLKSHKSPCNKMAPWWQWCSSVANVKTFSGIHKVTCLTCGKHPVGNILLSLAVLMGGASVSKVLLLFRHLGLCCYSPRTFFSHQRSFIFPIVICHWELYRAGLVSKLRDMKDVVWWGDGRFDSMGHSAKYGAYTMFSTSIMKVVHFELVQVWKALTSCHSLSTKIFQQLLCSYCNN